MRSVQLNDISGEFNHGTLHAEAYAEKGNPVFSCILDGLNLPVNSTRTKSGCDDNSVQVTQLCRAIFCLNGLAVNPINFHMDFELSPGVNQCFCNGFVAVF